MDKNTSVHGFEQTKNYPLQLRPTLSALQDEQSFKNCILLLIRQGKSEEVDNHCIRQALRCGVPREEILSYISSMRSELMRMYYEEDGGGGGI
jgi:hypothetical protein